MIINDVELFKIALYRDFVRNGHIHTPTPFWKNILLIGGVAGSTPFWKIPLLIEGVTGFTPFWKNPLLIESAPFWKNPLLIEGVAGSAPFWKNPLLIEGVARSTPFWKNHLLIGGVSAGSTPFWKNPLFIGGVAGALVVPLAFTGLVAMLGFGAGGIASGSFAAWFMSLYGGAVSSGSVCAILQSIGVAGLGATGVIATGSAGAAAGAAIANSTTATAEVIEEFYEKNKLSESEERSLENFLKIEQSSINTIKFNFKNPILEKKFINTLLQVLIVVIPFANSKIFVFKYDDFGDNFILSDYILDKLRETFKDEHELIHGNLYVSEGIKLDLSTFDFKNEHELIREWKRKNNKK